ncbi:armadillo-type protein [Melanogaster broomeanus]|nr:armadillo-type protein [Melanogaster broomeanus]
MDVPFVSSGAMTRTHYALVRKVEGATSPQAADQVILSELDVIRQNLQRPHLSIKQCKECLILLMYCTMSLTTTGPGDLDFSFPHAINLAELGQSLMDKKIGYIFCVELMPSSHELQLMLVNTLRKDLESPSIARICLALDVLTQTSNEDVIPAVETRLQSLLRHESVVVRKHAYIAYYTLFRHDTEHLLRLEDALIQPNRWTDPFVAGSTLTAVGKALRDAQENLSFSPVASIRHLLPSSDPNDQYLFVSCLSCLGPSTWAGTLGGTTAVLDEWEVQEVMKLLDSRDPLIRKMTLKVLHSIDPTIVETYYLQSLQRLSPTLPLDSKSEYVIRLLEVVDMQHGDDVDQYAKHLKDLFAVVEGRKQGWTENLAVLESSVTQVLNGIRDRDASFRISCVTALAMCMWDRHSMVVISALVCEYCGKISTSPLEMLRGLASRLASIFAASVQDACILSMLRLTAECDEVPEDVISTVHGLSQFAGRHLRRRCDQFLALSTQRRVLADVISRAPSSSLPDFLSALTSYQAKRSDSSGFSPSGTAALQRKLRYEAYAAPQPVRGLRHLPKSRTRSLSRASDTSQSLNELARTITPGELTLTAAKISFDMIQKVREFSRASRTPGLVERPSGDDLAGANASMDAIVRLLQSLQYRMRVIALDQPSFEGELKVLVQGSTPEKCAALRLREGDDESCLWRLHCEELEMRTAIKRLLEEI